MQCPGKFESEILRKCARTIQIESAHSVPATLQLAPDTISITCISLHAFPAEFTYCEGRVLYSLEGSLLIEECLQIMSSIPLQAS